MKTYFIRHSASWNVDDGFRGELWKEGKVAIKFADIRSRDPSDYEGTAKGAVARFCDLADNGGYVCTTIHPHGCMVGKVRPETKIEFQKILDPNTNRKTAIAKVLRLASHRKLEPAIANRLLIGQPQQGTISEWHIIEDRVAQFVDRGQIAVRRMNDLLPYEQEVMCAEFLRSDLVTKTAFPRLACLSAPVGGTRKAVDISGVSAKGKPILAQVTHHHLESRESKAKLDSLVAVGQSTQARMVFFCRTNQPVKRGDVMVFPIEKVFDEMKKVAAWRAAFGVASR